MVELFRYIEQSHPARRTDDTYATVGGHDTDLQVKLTRAREAENADRRMVEIAEQFLGDGSFVEDVSDLRFGERYESFARRIRTLDPDEAEPSLRTLVREVFDSDVEEVVQSTEFTSDKQRLDDSLIALKLAPEHGAIDGSFHVRVRKILGLLERLASEGRFSTAFLTP
jgi:hypothetical protein